MHQDRDCVDGEMCACVILCDPDVADRSQGRQLCTCRLPPSIQLNNTSLSHSPLMKADCSKKKG